MSIEQLFEGDITDEIKQLVRERLRSDNNLFVGETHKLRDGLTKEQARTVLMLAFKFARECGLQLSLNADEQKLMRKNFSV
jgi:hypothetical protein